MDKELFRKTEGRLYRYYKDEKRIRSINSEVEELLRQTEYIKRDIQFINVPVDAELNMGISYGEIVQTSSTGTCAAESQIFRHIEKLENELAYIRKKILKKNAKVREIERNNASMKFNINSLGEEEKRFIELKYGDEKTMEYIIVDMYGGAKTTAYRKREELIKNIAMWSDIS